jgi:hypothetical protein
MGSVTHPRRRLPRRVYWVRRGMVLLVAFLLVFGIGKLLGGTGADDPGSAIKANTSSAGEQQAAGGSATLGPVAPSTKVRTKAKVPLLPPSGKCLDDEVTVLPSVPRAWAGTPSVIWLQLQGTQPACTFDVSPESMVVKIASGKDRIWSSQECPKAIPTTQVVVRSGQPVSVPVIWSGRRSDEQCTNEAGWAFPGFYHVYAAAFGSTPTDVQFEVTRAPTRTVTRTPKPKASPSATTAQPSAPTSQKATPKPKAKPRATPSATVAGKGSKCGGDNAASSC